MANKINLKEFDEWRNLNKEGHFSLYDYIFHIIALRKVRTDIYFAFLEFFWPNFIVYKNYVFLKENFSEEKLVDFVKYKEKNVEFWMNLLLIDPYFKDDEDWEEKSKSLSKALSEIWSLKLKKDFPNVKFKVENLEDPENGDYGLTFYRI